MSEAKDFEVGSTIELTSDPKKKGVVLGNNLKVGPAWLAVEWSDGTLDRVMCGDVKQSLSVEEEFELVKTSINDKLKEAARLIKEAAKDAKDAGTVLLTPEYGYVESEFNVDVIEAAMDQAGWNTSSWHC